MDIIATILWFIVVQSFLLFSAESYKPTARNDWYSNNNFSFLCIIQLHVFFGPLHLDVKKEKKQRWMMKFALERSSYNRFSFFPWWNVSSSSTEDGRTIFFI